MVLYRRNRVAGGTYFFTVTLKDRKSTLLVDQIDPLRAAFYAVKHAHPFHIDALVILPEHLHAIWTLPPGDCVIKRGLGKPWSAPDLLVLNRTRGIE